MKFVVGIGNPGKQYEATRHNVGFQVVELLASVKKAKWKARPEWQAWVAPYDMATWLIKPETFVNRTGDSLAAMPQADEYLVVSDDVNLLFGRMRLRDSGSAGGHHGLESVIEHLGSEDFPRLRIGVGDQEMPKDLTSFVLEKFSKAQEKELSNLLENAASVCEAWINEGFQSAQDRLSRLQSVKEKGE